MVKENQNRILLRKTFCQWLTKHLEILKDYYKLKQKNWCHERYKTFYYHGVPKRFANDGLLIQVPTVYISSDSIIPALIY